MKTSSILLLISGAVLILSDEFHPKNGYKIKSNIRVVEDKTFWNNLGQQLLRDEINKQTYNVQAKNIIIFLGDGMSISTVTAARIYKGQKSGQTGEEAKLEFDKFPFAGFSRTYCTNSQVADSACSATAFLGGIKSKRSTLGLDDNVIFKNCSTQNDETNKVFSVFKWAQDAGKGTGIITTSSVTDATPGAGYAHVANRDWEDDTRVAGGGQDPNTCDDIPEQLVFGETGKRLNVMMGGGRQHFTRNTDRDPENQNTFGRRQDGKNLIDQWSSNHNTDGAYVWNRDQLLSPVLNNITNLLGLFAPSALEYFIESAGYNDPTLEEMTRAAITLLQKQENGFVLLVEGGLIDNAHHAGRAKVALEEVLQFDLAIDAALNMTNRSDTLIIVTADHSHTMTINGYPARGTNILGLAEDLGIDSKPYSTLSYGNGPGYVNGYNNGVGGRVDLTTVDTTADSFRQPAFVPLSSETHAGEDVGIFAIGPQAHMFQGVYEQIYIAHLMNYAAAIGPGLKFNSTE